MSSDNEYYGNEKPFLRVFSVGKEKLIFIIHYFSVLTQVGTDPLNAVGDRPSKGVFGRTDPSNVLIGKGLTKRFNQLNC